MYILKCEYVYLLDKQFHFEILFLRNIFISHTKRKTKTEKKTKKTNKRNAYRQIDINEENERSLHLIIIIIIFSLWTKT